MTARDTDTMDSIVVLHVVQPSTYLTKTLGQSPDGKWKIVRDYGGISRVRATEHSVRDIASLAKLLEEVGHDPKKCVIRGGLRPEFEAAAQSAAGVRRLAYDRPGELDGQAAFEPRAQSWVACDMDSFPLPDSIDPITQPQEIITEALDRLPPEFQNASCFWQLTSGHGIKPGGRVRLFFWLSRPTTNAEATRWIPKNVADPAVHRTVQPIYIAAPIFPQGLSDFLPSRCGLRIGGVDQVEVPDLETWSRDNPDYTGRDTGLDAESVEAALEMMGDPPAFPDGQGFHNPIAAAFKAAIKAFGCDVNQAALLAQIAAKLRERIGLRGDAYLNRRLRDAQGWLPRYIQQAKTWEDRSQREVPEQHGLAAYYQPPVEPREKALARQNTTITRVICEAVSRAMILHEVCARSDAEIEASLENLTPPKKAAITRRIKRDVLVREGLSRVPKRQRALVTGAAGSGKTTAALESAASIRGDVIVWNTQPFLWKAGEAAADYALLAVDDSLPWLVVRGRAAADPESDDTRMCPRHAVLAKAVRKGVPVRQVICKTCALQSSCGYLRQERRIADMGGRGIFFLSKAYVFLPCPAPKPDLLIIDESVTIEAINEPITLPAASIEQARLYQGGGNGALANAIKVGQTLTALYTALREPRALAVLREAGITADDLRFVRTNLEAALEEPDAGINGRMPDDEISERLDALEESRIRQLLALVAAVIREIELGRDTLTGVVYDPASADPIETAIAEATVTIFRLRETVPVRSGTSILVLDGTGSPTLNAMLFPGIAHIHTPIERLGTVTGTQGRGYSRQSLTGKDRHGNAIPIKTAAAKKLRGEIGRIAARLKMPFVASNLPVITAFEQDGEDGEMPGDARFAHFGKVRGLNEWKDCSGSLVVGREAISIAALEALARAYLARDPQPFVSFDQPPPAGWPWPFWPYRATRGRRMRNGSVQPVAVEIHPDPRCQEILEQIREAEVLQAADRVRAIFNPRDLVLMNNLVLDVTYDRVLTHAEVVAGGNRWELAMIATGPIRNLV